jgi:1-acyl-sn-glycerol-3-phosphate acyltransferase
MCRLLGIKVHTIGAPSGARPLLIVANHSSWMDISILTSLTPVVFVAKSEIARWPLFGLLARLQRTVFVERDRRQKTAAVNAEIARRLAEGDPVLLFGEGTAGDGNRVLAFRSALIGAARDALAASEHVQQVWIQPVSLAYVSQHGIPFGRHLRPRAAWYGKTSLVPHLKRVAREGAIDVVVTWGEPLRYDPETDRKTLTRQLESSVRRFTVAALRGAGPTPQTAA